MNEIKDNIEWKEKEKKPNWKDADETMKDWTTRIKSVRKSMNAEGTSPKSNYSSC